MTELKTISKYLILILFYLLISHNAFSKNTLLELQQHQKILPAEHAFILLAEILENNKIQLEWQIAPDNYLYKNKIKIVPFQSENIFTYELPLGEIFSDPSFGQQMIYREQLKFNLIPNKNLFNFKVAYFTVYYQGCNNHGFCYPPQTQHFQFKTQDGIITKLEPINLNALNTETQPILKTSEDTITRWFNQLSHHWKWLGFYLIGLTLAFTPCVLPMLPILSGIIAGPTLNNNPRKAFQLTLTYVFSIALTYAFAGVVTAKLGASLQGTLQRPLYIILFSILFIYLGISQLGFLPLHLPQKIQNHLNILQQKQKSGTYLGAFSLGILATLLASPCVSGPLVGLLSLIAQTGDVWAGAFNLFMMGLGMGTLLLIAGSIGSHYLPKAGAWMTRINQVIALMLFGLSIWMLSRILNPSLILASWGALCVLAAYLLGAFNLRQVGWAARIGTLVLIYGIILIIGGSRGHTKPLSPLDSKLWDSRDASVFNATIRSLSELNEAFIVAKKLNKPLLLDFYATWCVSCINMEKYVYSDPNVQNLLSKVYFIKADITNFNIEEKKLMQHYSVIAPPTLLFFSKNGIEYSKTRLVGELNSKVLKEHLGQILRNEAE